MKLIEGNLVEMADNGEFDIIIHGCNCFCTMGAGIAKAIRDRWPEAYTADKATKKGDKGKLGSMSLALVENRVNRKLLIVNLYTQYRFGRDKCHFEYDPFRYGLRLLRRNIWDHQRVGMPMIGAGLAGGDWKRIRQIIEEEFDGVNYTVVLYHGKGRW